VVRCTGCRTPHHAVCFEENGGCTSLGCRSPVSSEAGPSLHFPAPKIDLRAWRDVGFEGSDAVLRMRSASDRVGAARAATSVQLTLDRDHLVEGQSLKLRLTVDLIEAGPVKRLVLELRHTDHAISATILGAPRGAGLRRFLGGLLGRDVIELEPGSFTYELEVPRLFGGPFAARPGTSVSVEARLERPGRDDVVSPAALVVAIPPANDLREHPPLEVTRAAPPEPVALFLPAPAPLEPLDPEGRREARERANAADEARVEWREDIREPTPPAVASEEDDDLIVPVRKGRPAARSRKPTARTPRETKKLEIVVRPRRTAGDWTLIRLRDGERSSARVLRARVAARPPSGGELSIAGPERARPGDALELAVDGPSRLSSLELVVRWARDHGVALDERAWLIGAGALAGPLEPGLDVVLPIDDALVDDARRAGARVLAVELALEGLDERAFRQRSPARRVTVDL
jgi:hypothetical protein